MDRQVLIFRKEKASRSVLKGQADPLNSAFHLTYNMVLNLLRVEEINPEYMLERSFYQFQNYSTIPEQVESMYSLYLLNLGLFVTLKFKSQKNSCVFTLPHTDTDTDKNGLYGIMHKCSHIT